MKTVENINFAELADLRASRPTVWLNRALKVDGAQDMPISAQEVAAAADRLDRFKPFFKAVFSETQSADGLIESPVVTVEKFQAQLARRQPSDLTGKLLLKKDAYLPISGSIKARGGIYEVIKRAEHLALKAGLITPTDDYAAFASDRFKQFFGDYRIAVGSTGNLGLSIGIIGKALGFAVDVHMSADAKQWKKEKLRSIGVNVIEYQSDYSAAVESGRQQAAGDRFTHFVDDENSRDLFLGYAVAGQRTKRQLDAMGVVPTEQKPLYVYLPCGVGGGPGGVAYGLKMVYGAAVKPYFAEPVASPCMLLGMATGLHNKIAVQDIGLTNLTEADGLAVGRASGLVGRLMMPLLEGVYTVADQTLFELLRLMYDSEGIFLEPSALAGAIGPWQVASKANLVDDAYHLIWSTGGGMVPLEERKAMYQKRL